jgi:hypothetical protein
MICVDATNELLGGVSNLRRGPGGQNPAGARQRVHKEMQFCDLE